ncbi:MAG: HAD hydrolase family protein [Planctomycetes bacterium]|jgi:3-deoxy-D-manno-octulosonate 8-phosphate phosphatase (KDO 8-P phosphatase)|nr:HAD hydrolase family protein [Planctomycetota bacterium]
MPPRDLDRIDFKSLRLLVLDVDGVMTDGGVMLTESGEEIKTFHVRDGSGIKYWQRTGGLAAMLTGRGSPAVLRRAEELQVDAVRINAIDKLPVYREILRELNVAPEHVAVIGDDLIDLPLLRNCAFGATVADAVEEVKAQASYIAKAPGGRGAVREVIELIMKRAGTWARILQRYEPQQAEAQHEA